jgi:hypothetical protein
MHKKAIKLMRALTEKGTVRQIDEIFEGQVNKDSIERLNTLMKKSNKDLPFLTPYDDNLSECC